MVHDSLSGTDVMPPSPARASVASEGTDASVGVAGVGSEQATLRAARARAKRDDDMREVDARKGASG
jgi:hypothetical protein